jgi:hypothetical protein
VTDPPQLYDSCAINVICILSHIIFAHVLLSTCVLTSGPEFWSVSCPGDFYRRLCIFKRLLFEHFAYIRLCRTVVDDSAHVVGRVRVCHDEYLCHVEEKEGTPVRAIPPTRGCCPSVTRSEHYAHHSGQERSYTAFFQVCRPYTCGAGRLGM